MMKKLTNLIAICFFIYCDGFSQYKNASVGLSYGNGFSKDFNSIGVDFQYNFKSTFSFRTGVYLDRFNRNGIESYESSYDAQNNPISLMYRKDFSTDRYSVPFLLQASFGKVIYFNVFAGMIVTGTLSNPSVKSEMYQYSTTSFDYQLTSSSNYREAPKVHSELKPYYGFGLTWPSKSGFTINLEYANSYLFKKSLPTNGVADLNAYSFDKSRIRLGVAYQFNFSKKDNFRMKNYYLKMTRTIDGN